MMSLKVSLDEKYTKSRINDWYINIYNNNIYGVIKPFGLTIEKFTHGYILAWADNYVIAKIDCRIYALILGTIAPDKVNNFQLYMNYLRHKLAKPQIVI